MAKTPCLGYYVMKGYQPKAEEGRNHKKAQSQSSEKIITNILRKYLHRKEESNSLF